jgi:hypothetical protein
MEVPSVTIVPPARPTIYRGIRMRSRLEATIAEWMDDRELAWSYEGPAYAQPGSQYLPDFRLPKVMVEGTPVELYVEVKPPNLEDGQPGFVGRTLTTMEGIWASNPAARLMLIGGAIDPYAMPMRWQQDTDRVLATGIWARCERCNWVGVEDYYHWDRLFYLAHEPWWCPTCSHPGFNPISPWVSQQYRRYQGLFGDAEGP